MPQPNPQPGMVYLIGAGPGDPGLITVRGIECLGRADVVVYDRLANHSLLAHARNAELIDVGKQPHRHPVPQEKINELLVQYARAGKVVARLKGGDPFVFGRGGEEALALVEAGLPFEIVPGVTSAIAGPAYAGIPVTHRGLAYSVAFITGHRAGNVDNSGYNWPYLATGPDTLVFLMGVSNLPMIVDQLIRHGRPPDTPAALVERASRTAQKTAVGVLADIVERVAHIRPPAVIIIGKVVGLAKSLRWFDLPERRPLLGLRVLNTRPLAQAGEFSRRLMELGAEVVELPATRIEPVDDTTTLDTVIRRLVDHAAWDWIIFSSPNNVTYFLDRLLALGYDVRSLSRVKLAVMGRSTAGALLRYGLRPDFTPTRHTSEGLVCELGDVCGQRVLLPRANVAAPRLADLLAARGASVEMLTTYMVQPADPDPVSMSTLVDGGVDVVTFVSPSAVTGLVKMLTEQRLTLPLPIVAACIGPATIEAAQVGGFQVDITPEKHTVEGLLDALIRWRVARRNKAAHERRPA